MNHINLFLTCQDLRSSNKHAALKNYLFITREIIQENSVKSINWKIAPTWNHEFELPDGFHFVSDIQDYMEYIIKKHGTLKW